MRSNHSRWRRTTWRAVIGAAAAASMTALLDAQQLSYTGAVYGSTGDYIFSRRTTTWSLSNGLVVGFPRIRLSASLPLVYQSTPWVTLSGAGPVPTGGPHRGNVAEAMGGPGRRAHRIALPDTGSYDQIGLGDPLFLATVDVVTERLGRPGFYLTVGLKAPVGSVDQGFSTGELDYAAGLGTSLMIGRTLIVVDGTYFVMGDMPELPLRDVLAYSASVGRLLGDGEWAALASVMGSGAAVSGTDPPAQAGLAIRRVWPSGRSLMLVGLVGLTSSSPDVSLSLGWRVPLEREQPDVIATRASAEGIAAR